jgi:hypothetical protein
MVIRDRDNKFRELIENNEGIKEILEKRLTEAKIIILILSVKEPCENNFCKTDFWNTIRQKFYEKTVVIVAASDLRSVGINAKPECSFEQTVDNFYTKINHPCLQELHKLQHLLVLFDNSGVLHFSKNNSAAKSYTYHLVPRIGDNILAQGIASQPMKFGSVVGYRMLLAAAIVKKLVAPDPDKENIKDLELKEKEFVESLKEGIYLGIEQSKQYFLRGFDSNKIFNHNNYENKNSDSQNKDDDSYNKMIKSFFPEKSDGKEICIASMPVRLDGSKILRSRIEIIYDQLYRKGLEENFEKKLFEIVKKGLKKVSEDSLDEKKPLSEEDSLPQKSNATSKAQESKDKSPPWKQIHIPYAKFGKILTADRDEIDSYLDIMLLAQKYFDDQTWKTPLCLAVFGPPGSGKSFVVREILKTIPGLSYGESLNYNLAQFASVEDLTTAFHQVQDRALREEVPLVIFDEFDVSFNSEKLGWLKYFLAPMQDGEFKGRSGTYKVGRAIFVFAGGINRTYDEFTTQYEEDGDTFKTAKGPDFVSRLRGYLNIKGINSGDDKHWPSLQFRRAIILRSLLEKDATRIIHGPGPEKEADINEAVVYAFLNIPKYHHGVRSMEAIIQMAVFDKDVSVGHERFIVGALPSKEQLSMHVNAEEFIKLLEAKADTEKTKVN